jgi:raffinose/stachyose/melibiose transport system substrate-binding protein
VTASCAEDAEKYEAAMTFLSYFYSGENYGNLCENTYTFPLTTQTTAYEVTQMQQDVYTSFADADKQISVYIGNEDTPQEFEKKMLNITISILDGDLSLEDGLQWIQESWEQLCIQKEGE